LSDAQHPENEMNKKKPSRNFKKKHLKIQVQERGGWYTARYEGRAEKVFGASPEEAISRLKNGR